MYKAIDRKTQNFHVIYESGGPTIINLLDGNRELFYFYNHEAQTDFLSRIQGRELSDALRDSECRALVLGQPHSFPHLENLLEYKPKFLQKLFSLFKKK